MSQPDPQSTKRKIHGEDTWKMMQIYFKENVPATLLIPSTISAQILFEMASDFNFLIMMPALKKLIQGMIASLF